jgi:hypothetical protein
MLKYNATHLSSLAKLKTGDDHFTDTRTLLPNHRYKLNPKYLVGLYRLSWIKQMKLWLGNVVRYSLKNSIAEK